MNVTEELADWEDSRNMNRKRQWFTIDDALQQLALHKPVQRRYLQQLEKSRNIMTTSHTENTAITTTTTNTTSSSASNQIPESESESSSNTPINTTTDTNPLTEQASSIPIQESTSKTATAI